MSGGTEILVEPRDHVVQFYERDQDLVETVSAFLAEGLLSGEAAIVVATGGHTVAFAAALAAAGIDLAAARQSGRLVTLDAAETLSRLIVGGRPDAGAFEAVVGGLLRRTDQSGRRMRVYGEMVALLWDAGQVPAAIELEALWNELGRDVPFSLFCAYARQSVSGHDHAGAFTDVCRLHSAVVGAPSLLGSTEAAATFRAALDAPRSARRFVVESLEEWGRRELTDDAALVVTELATNAVVHAQSDFVVAVSSDDGVVRISVGDANMAAPVPRDSTMTAVSGRGLALVAAAATRWGTELVGDGKVVWVELAGDPGRVR